MVRSSMKIGKGSDLEKKFIQKFWESGRKPVNNFTECFLCEKKITLEDFDSKDQARMCSSGHFLRGDELENMCWEEMSFILEEKDIVLEDSFVGQEIDSKTPYFGCCKIHRLKHMISFGN